MTPSSKPDPESLLVELFEGNSEWLAQYQWEWEGDRWVELLICVVDSSLEIDPLVVRNALTALNELDLLDVPELLGQTAEDLTFMRSMLVRLKFSEEDAAYSVDAIRATAAMAKKAWGGFVQRFLRKHAEDMRRELASKLMSTGMTRQVANKAAVLWLQNVAHMPVLLPHDPNIAAFCKRHGHTEKQLVSAADRLGMNLAIIDDLLAMEARNGDSKRGSRTRKSAARG